MQTGTCSCNGSAAWALTAVFECCQKTQLLLNAGRKPGHLEGQRGCSGRVCSHRSQEAVIPVAESQLRIPSGQCSTGWRIAGYYWLTHLAVCLCISVGELFPGGALNYPLCVCVFICDREAVSVCRVHLCQMVLTDYFYSLWVPCGWGLAGHIRENS